MPSESQDHQPAPRENRHGGVLAVVLIYAVFAALWILLSDQGLQLLSNDPAQITLISMMKGWAFVGVTSLLLYGLMNRLIGLVDPIPNEAPANHIGFVAWPRWAIYGLALAASVGMLLVHAGISHSFSPHPLLILFIFPIILSAILGGFGPGLLATLITSIGAALFVKPQGLSSSHDIFQWSLLIANGLLVSVLAEVLHRARRQTEMALAERSRAMLLLQSIADGSDDAIFAKDREGRYLLFNRAAVRASGKSQEAVLGRDDHALFPPEQAAMLMAIGQRVMAEDRLECNEETLTTADGERVFLATKGPLHDSDGRIVGIFGISRDISRQKQAESTLRQERDLKQRYLDTAQTLMLALDAEGRITMINRAGCALLGYAESELLGRLWFETALPQPDGMERVYPVYLRIMAGDLQTAEYFENEVLCRDGSQRLIAWHNAYLTDDAGEVIGTLSSGEDITERRKAEVALKQLTDDMTATLQAIPDLLFELDETGRYNSVKASQESLLAAPIAQLLGRSVREVLPPEAAQTIMDALAQAGRTGADYGRTITLPVTDGPRCFELSVARKPGAQEQLRHFIVMSRDITTRKATEAALRQQTEELRTRNEELERFNRAVVGRELDMVALKQRVNALSGQLGLAPPYPLGFLDASADQPGQNEAE
jgi:PAS domain S-box-containing protein